MLPHPIAILAYDAEAALYHAQERVRQASLGYNAPYADGQIAAIAAANGLTLVTRNMADFRYFKRLNLEVVCSLGGLPNLNLIEFRHKT